jgi:hypothetical protein
LRCIHGQGLPFAGPLARARYARKESRP